MLWARQAQKLPSLRGIWQRGFAGVAFSSLPVIDVAPLVDPNSSAAARAEVGRKLHSACTDVGFFYVTGHDVPREVSEGVIAQARRWFQLPDAVKQLLALSPATHYRGYQALGTNVTRYDGGFARDWHEGIDLYKEVGPEAAAGAAPSPIHGINPWPTQLPEFDAVLRQYISACLGLGQALMRGIALGLQLPENFFEEGASGTTASSSYWVSRVLRYPPLQQASQAAAAGADTAHAALGAHIDRSVHLSCGEHSDYGMLTIVNQEPGLSALQVKNADGAWIDAAPMDGTLVVNIGDMLHVWTNGLYVPTVHRVVNAASKQSRISCPFFYEPSYEAVVQPVPQLCGGAAPRFGAVRYGDHLESKVLRNFELQ